MDKTYGTDSLDGGSSVAHTNDGGYIIVGETYSSIGAGSRDIYLIRTDANGVELWNKTYAGPAIDDGLSVVQTNDGGFIITGQTFSFGNGMCDVYLIKTNSDNGDTLWTKTYGGADEDGGWSIARTVDGGFIICGATTSFGPGSENIYLIKTDNNGNVTGINNNISPTQKICISPNPFSQSTQITLNQTYQNIALAVYDIQGKQVAQQHYTNCSQIQLHRNQLTNGLYFVKLTLDDKAVETVKMVVGE